MSKKIALLMGVSDYKNIDSLPMCQKDIEVVTLIINGINKYDEVLVIDEALSAVAAKNRIAKFVSSFEQDIIDEILVYYSGHGMRHSDDFYYLFSDYNRERHEQTSLSNTELDGMFRSLNPSLMVKVIDACKSGSEYIKSDESFKALLDGSTKGRFNDVYFLFSSEKTENSIGLHDFSVFTKSFVQALLQNKGGEIRYKDILSFISDDQAVKNHQVPFFIVQAKYTEVLGCLDDELFNKVESIILEHSNDNNASLESFMNDDDTPVELSAEDKLIAEIDAKNRAFCTEEEAQKALNFLLELVRGYEWSSLLRELYEINQHACNLVSADDANVTAIAKWLEDSGEPYFVGFNYDTEEFQVEKPVEYRRSGGIGNMSNIFGEEIKKEYKTVTEYRDVLSSYYITVDCPDEFLSIEFIAKKQILPSFIIYIAYAFTKSKLTVFYKYEKYKESSWQNREPLNENSWGTQSCPLKYVQEIENLVTMVFTKLVLDIEQECEQVVENV